MKISISRIKARYWIMLRPCQAWHNTRRRVMKGFGNQHFEERQDPSSRTEGLLSLAAQHFPSGSKGQKLFSAPSGHFLCQLRLLLAATTWRLVAKGNSVKVPEWCSIACEIPEHIQILYSLQQSELSWSLAFEWLFLNFTTLMHCSAALLVRP